MNDLGMNCLGMKYPWDDMSAEWNICRMSCSGIKCLGMEYPLDEMS